MRRAALGILAAAVLARSALSLGAGLELARAAEAQAGVTLAYDPAYVRLAYPAGDVRADRGVCSDVVVRAFRRIGVDLQVELHEDMTRHFDAYPRSWGLQKADPNIDHRRVQNLMKYFQRRGKALRAGARFEPGDVVAWRLPNRLYHIGIIAERRTSRGRQLVVHNIGQGTKVEDVLQAFELIGHYRW